MDSRRTTVAATAFVASLVMILAAFTVLAGRRVWFGLPLLGLGLLLNAGLMGFLWKAFQLFGARCGELERDKADLDRQVALHHATLEAVEDGLLLVDAKGRTLAFNGAFVALCNLPGGVLRPGGELLSEDFLLAQLKDPDGLQVQARRLRGSGKNSTDTFELWDGRVFECRSRPLAMPQPGGAPDRLWSLKDVTARVKADLFVHRLAQAVEQCPVSIVITDTTGSMEFVNPQFTNLTGYALDEALGQTPRILKSGLMPALVYEELWSTITAGNVWVGDLQNRKKSGELFWERATISPMRDPDGVITHFLGIKEDITPRKQLEQQLRQAQKLEAVGLLAGGVAHDFNNLLQVINGYGSLMQMTQAADDPQRQSLAEILKAAERAAQLTHSLLAFSRKQVMNPRTVDLNSVVGNVEKLLRRVLGEDVHLAVTRLDAPLLVHVDLGQIEQVLLNLATNARDAMPKGGRLAITTDLFHLDEAFLADQRFGKPGDYALLQVRDSGDGMDEATMKRIFDPFFTTKEMGRGTGLGLAMVYGIVKQHHGYILVDSMAGEGSVFKVYLPIVVRPTEPLPDNAPQDDRVKGTETILLAEDEPAVRGIMELVLRKFGYQVILAEDGQDAVERFQAHRETIDLVLMDIIMPRKSGRQAFDEIKRVCPQMKVLFTSGYTAEFIKNRGDLGEGMELIMKPVQPLVLLRKLREILDR